MREYINNFLQGHLGSKAGPVVVFGTEFSIGERLLSSEEDTRMADIRDNEA